MLKSHELRHVPQCSALKRSVCHPFAAEKLTSLCNRSIPIRFEKVRRCTLMIRCTTLMDTWSEVLLLILPRARTAASCKMEPSLGPVGFLSSLSLSLSSWVSAVSSPIASPGFRVCVAQASSPSVVTGVTMVPFAVCSPSSSLSESAETLSSPP